MRPLMSVLTVTPSMFGRKFSVTMQMRRGREASKVWRASIAVGYQRLWHSMGRKSKCRP